MQGGFETRPYHNAIHHGFGPMNKAKSTGTSSPGSFAQGE